MSVSAIFGVRLSATPTINCRNEVKMSLGTNGSNNGLIECSSRPQKKATAHHMKTRPKKTQPWDIRRGPAVYAPLPPLPPDWTLVTPAAAAAEADADADAETDAVVADSIPSPVTDAV